MECILFLKQTLCKIEKVEITKVEEGGYRVYLELQDNEVGPYVYYKNDVTDEKRYYKGQLVTISTYQEKYLIIEEGDCIKENAYITSAALRKRL